MKWKQYSVLTCGTYMDEVAKIFHQMGSGGVIIEDPFATMDFTGSEDWDAPLPYPDYENREVVVIKAYFPDERDVRSELSHFIAEVQDKYSIECKVLLDEVNDEDWINSWKEFYHTFKVGKRLVVQPSWESYDRQEGEEVIVIDPGMAFGTGVHASTRFCLQFLDDFIQGGEKVIDAGCGSGILSIAAAKLGASSVLAMDIDPAAVKIAQENIHVNDLVHRVKVAEGNVLDILEQEEADIILANLTADVISPLIPEAAKSLRQDGLIFASGILDKRWPAIQAELEQHGFKVEKVLTEADWVGAAARKVQV